jgi:hypothetical protein
MFFARADICALYVAIRGGMMNKFLRKIVAGLFALPGTFAHAAPMGFEDSWMAMGDVSENWGEVWTNYAFTPRDAVGAGYVFMRSDDKTKERKLSEINYTRLLHRWNLPNAQANMWLFGSVGRMSGNDFSGSKTAYAPGVQLDYETTRVYFAAASRLYRAEGIKHDFNSLRAGFSFYTADYEDTQPWLVVEARRMRGLSDETEITPMLRLINKRYFLEIGVNLQRQPKFSFMYVF